MYIIVFNKEICFLFKIGGGGGGGRRGGWGWGKEEGGS